MKAGVISKTGAFHGKNVTNQFYMKNYVQESLRYLREKAQEHEKELRNQIDENVLEENKVERENKNKNIDGTPDNEKHFDKNKHKVCFLNLNKISY